MPHIDLHGLHRIQTSEPDPVLPGVPFGREEYTALAGAMRGLKGRAILSINDHPDMREAFAEFRVKRVAHAYTMGGAKSSRTAVGELIYRTW